MMNNFLILPSLSEARIVRPDVDGLSRYVRGEYRGDAPEAIVRAAEPRGPIPIHGRARARRAAGRAALLFLLLHLRGRRRARAPDPPATASECPE